jgi:hypothetical protein
MMFIFDEMNDIQRQLTELNAKVDILLERMALPSPVVSPIRVRKAQTPIVPKQNEERASGSRFAIEPDYMEEPIQPPNSISRWAVDKFNRRQRDVY